MNPINPLLHPIAFETPRRISRVTPWQAHTPFGMYLVELLRPKTIVELGTHSGDSYCAFCQAVSELGLPTMAFAVDTWVGDPHAGSYTEDVFKDLKAHHDPLYSGFSELMRMTFDEALPRFADSSIDLLHIDGCHRYEVVKHDFEGWLPKVSSAGVVLLHDTARTVDDFGVWKLLAELREEYPCLEFMHGSGLALVLVGGEPAPELVELTRLEGEELTGFRSFFAALGEGVRRAGEIQRTTDAEARIRLELEERRSLEVAHRVEVGEHGERLGDHGRRLEDHERRLLDHTPRLEGHDEHLAGHDERLAVNDKHLTENDEHLAANDVSLADHEARLARLEQLVGELADSRLLRLGRTLRPGSGPR